MIHITRLDYISGYGHVVHSAEVDLWHSLSGINTLMEWFAAVYNIGPRTDLGDSCSEVLCTYKDYSKQPK